MPAEKRTPPGSERYETGTNGQTKGPGKELLIKRPERQDLRPLRAGRETNTPLLPPAGMDRVLRRPDGVAGREPGGALIVKLCTGRDQRRLSALQTGMGGEFEDHADPAPVRLLAARVDRTEVRALPG